MSDGISREYRTSPWNIRYARMDGSDMFFTHTTDTTKNSYKVGTAPPVNRLLNLFHRNIVHIAPKNLVVVYDRMNAFSQYRVNGAYAECRFISPQIETFLSGTTYKMDSSTKRRFRDRVLASEANPTWVTENLQTLYGTACYGSVTRLLLLIGDAYILNLIEGTTTAQSAMTAHEAACYLPASYGNRTMRGVTITTGDPTQTHILFSINIDGTTPSPIIDYHVTKGGASDKHFICDLIPNQTYFVTETVISGTVVHYVLAPMNNVMLKANSAGVLEFTPTDLATQTQTIPPVNIDDVGVGNGSDETVTYDTPIVNVTIDDVQPDKPQAPPGAPIPAVGSDDSQSSFTIALTGTTSQSIDINDTSDPGGSSDSVSVGTNQIIDINDSVTVDDKDSTFDIVSVYKPQGTYQEKLIRPASPFLYPNIDLGSNFASESPGDGVLWNKLGPGDDSTYIFFRAVFGIPPASFIPVAYASFGLDDPTGIARNIRTIRFGVRFASLATDAVNPLLVVKVYKASDTDHPYVQYNFSVDNTITLPTEFLSPALTVNMSAPELRDATIKIEPRATGSYGTVYDIRPSSLYVEMLAYDTPEKVI